MTETCRQWPIRGLGLVLGLTLVALAMARSASRPGRVATIVDEPTFSFGTTPGVAYRRHSWVIRNDSPEPLKLRTRFTSGRCGFSLWLGEDYAVPSQGLLTVSLTIPTPSRADSPFAGHADVMTDDPDHPRLRFRVFGVTGPSSVP